MSPLTFLSDANGAVHFVTTDAVPAIHNLPHRGEPLGERDLDLLKLLRPRLALIPRLQSHKEKSVIAAPHEAEQAEPNHARGDRTAGVPARIFSMSRAAALVRSSDAAFGS
jgi:hypothetical protein